jgi:hypothetical protein
MNAFRARRQTDSRIDLLPPEPGTTARRHGKRQPARLEVVDAEFVVIRTAYPRTSNDNRTPVRPVPASGHMLVRAAATCARVAEAGLQLLSGRAFAGLVAAAFIFVFAYAGGLSALEAARPAADSDDALRLADVTTALDDQNGMKVLSVYGSLHNAGGTMRAVPPIDVVIHGSGSTMRHRVALVAEKLAAGGSEAFSLRVPHGGGKVPKVSVSLASEGASTN